MEHIMDQPLILTFLSEKHAQAALDYINGLQRPGMAQWDTLHETNGVYWFYSPFADDRFQDLSFTDLSHFYPTETVFPADWQEKADV